MSVALVYLEDQHPWLHRKHVSKSSFSLFNKRKSTKFRKTLKARRVDDVHFVVNKILKRKSSKRLMYVLFGVVISSSICQGEHNSRY